MMKYKISFYTGMILSLLIGLLHFFVPTLFGWYSYIPQQYEVLAVTIDYVNTCFSLLLFGLSAILLWWGKRIFEDVREAVTLYGFMTFVWIIRVIITLVNPCPSQANLWLNYGQIVLSVLIATLLVVPVIKLLITNKKNKRKERRG